MLFKFRTLQKLQYNIKFLGGIFMSLKYKCQGCAEETLYIEICPECRIITMFHQQT